MTDSDNHSLAPPKGEGNEAGPFKPRDLRCLLSLRTLQSLKAHELDVIKYHMLGMSIRDMKCKMDITRETISSILSKDNIIAAIEEARGTIASGLTSAADIAMATEAEVMAHFYNLTMDPKTPIEWVYKLGSKVLDHRRELLKACPVPIEMLSDGRPVEVIELSPNLAKRMAEHTEKS